MNKIFLYPICQVKNIVYMARRFEPLLLVCRSFLKKKFIEIKQKRLSFVPPLHCFHWYFLVTQYV